MKPIGADVVIVEGVSGTWYYHLAAPNLTSRSLCDRPTMSSQVQLAQLGESKPSRREILSHL